MSLKTSASAASLACLLLFAVCQQASAQSFGRTSSAGSSGSALGSGGFGSSGIGSGGFGSSGAGGTSGIGGASGFANANRFQVDSSAGEAFVGRDSQDVQTFFSADEAGRESFLQNLNLQQRNQSSTVGRRQLPPVRVTLRVAFDQRGLATDVVGANIESQLAKSLQGRLLAPRVTINGRTAVLMGQAGTDYERLLAEKLALLEPGVSQVENQIVVTATPSN